MSKLKLVKYPKKPKASASRETIENYFRRCREVDQENNRRKSEKKAHDAAVARLRRFKPGKTKAGGSTRRKKSTAKKTAKRRRK